MPATKACPRLKSAPSCRAGCHRNSQVRTLAAVGLAGSASFCGGQFTISGSGADIWGTADAFQFVYVYVPISTNCDIRARVVSVQNTSNNAKAAVMIRETLAAGSSNT